VAAIPTSPRTGVVRADDAEPLLDGSLGALLPGDLVLKPRGVPHAFWNATDEPARFLEVITPGGFEEYFAALGEVLAGEGPPDLQRAAEVAERFGLDLDPTSIPALAQTHGLVLA
jgi:hypothetical protein